jgi:YegS/Rv2252/BmrU family lipid kinase
MREQFNVELCFDKPDTMPDSVCTDPTGNLAAIVIGGDGTLRAVATRLLRPDMPPLLIVPMGTANLMGKHLGIKWKDATFEDDVLRVLRNHRVVHLDGATLNGGLFLLMAGVGLDAHVVHELDRIRKGPIGYLSYAIPAAVALQAYDFPPLNVEVDGRHVARDVPGLAFVGNIAEYGTGFPILPHASADDGMLDVCVLPCSTRAETFKLLLLAAAGEHLHAEEVIYLKGKQVRITSSQPVPVQVDGEAAGHTPVEIGLLPMKVPFIVPI